MSTEKKETNALESEPVLVTYEPVRDQKALTRAVEHSVQEIQAKYKTLREELEKKEKEEIAQFFERVHDGFNKKSCRVS